jgi:DNA-binding protein HU-beta
MNRRDLVLALSERLEIDRKEADRLLAGVVDEITAQVAKGETVSLPGFAKFARIDRPARMGRNPATGDTIKIAAKRVAKITPLKAFKDAALTGKVGGAAPAKKAAAKKAPAKAAAKKAPAKKAAVKKAPAKR